ncbi:hypothetical protein ABZ929_10285 [Streptomyces physcomitrii]
MTVPLPTRGAYVRAQFMLRPAQGQTRLLDEGVRARGQRLACLACK